MNTEPQAQLLIVDDDPMNILILSSIFEEYRVVTASSGEQALEIIEDTKPDLILLDVIMDGIDGYEVCSRLKSNPSTQDIPIIFLTGRDDEVSEIIGYELGAVDYITKPFNTKAIEIRVKNLIELKQTRDQLSNLETHI